MLAGERRVMRLFTPRTKMADIVHANYLVLPVLGRFGIGL